MGIVEVLNSSLGENPRLKLFLSADIVGSTAYKQPMDIGKADALNLQWPSVIQGFYSEARQAFRETWSDLKKATPKTDPIEAGGAPVFWKTVGDEVIFWKEINDDREIWLVLGCWLSVIARLRDYFKRVKAVGLDVKSTAWLAGFPVRNKAIPVLSAASQKIGPRKWLHQYYKDSLNEHPARGATVDFIGPGIDIGFRISQFSEAGKMAISLDCAYLLALTRPKIEEFQKIYKAASFFPDDVGETSSNGGPEIRQFPDKFRIRFDGTQALKGVLGGIHYPRFWLNTVATGSLAAAQHDLERSSSHIVGWSELETYCKEFYSNRSDFIARPFINNANSATFADLGDNYRALIGAMRKRKRR